ncbi:hypothetical protein ACINWCA157_1482 [Acinetobacter radioresistens WC-A-157]|uniref:hypothetical protein n=1 Tax=Acinetobacter radioresistens TaxID=40216 RepID=UPI000277BFD8|nr:hypothetical protein [Acinetobacter radioresistens]EJO35795.1 hypothetical protein ACINWCA157_1482 [Acinetobacter radioresistens WC-A-157]
MSFYLPTTSNIREEVVQLGAYAGTSIEARYRDISGVSAGVKQITGDKLRFDLTQGFDEQILSGAVRFMLGTDTYLDRTGTLVRNVNPANNSGTSSGSIQYGTGKIEIDSWTPNTDNRLTLQSLTTTTDMPPVNRISFRTPVSPLRPGSLTIVVATLDFGQLTLRADDDGIIETSRAHGQINYDTGFVDLFFYTKTEITESNRTGIEEQDWYDVLLEYDEAGKRYINIPVWVAPETVRYNAVAYTYIPLDAEILGLSATRLPLDGRVPIYRVGDIAIVSSSKIFELPDHIAGQTYELPDQRISWAELEDADGVKVPFDMYSVDYDYGKFTLGGDFALNALTAPLTMRYRYQDMLLIRDVQINGQLTFTKPLTHNYDAENTIVGSALVIGDMQARSTGKFVQQSWNSIWSDEATGGAISANYNDALYPIAVTNNGAIQERWALVFTSDGTAFRCIGEYSGQIGTGTVNTDFAPINPVTGVPYFVVKKEGWGSGWVSGNVLRFNTVAATFPVWVIRTVKQSEPTVLSDQFQVMLRGDIDREV